MLVGIMVPLLSIETTRFVNFRGILVQIDSKICILSKIQFLLTLDVLLQASNPPLPYTYLHIWFLRTLLDSVSFQSSNRFQHSNPQSRTASVLSPEYLQTRAACAEVAN